MRVARSLVVLACVLGALGACAKEHARGADDDSAWGDDGPVGPPDDEPSDAGRRKDAGATPRDADRADGEMGGADAIAPLPPDARCLPLVITLLAPDSGDPCAFQLGRLVSDPAYLHVALDGVQLTRDDADGWLLMDNTLLLRGKACALLEDRSKQHTLQASIECNRR